MSNTAASKSVAIVAHKYLTQPDDDLVAYLTQATGWEVIQICHSFIEAPDRRSSYRWYRHGQLFRQGHSPDFQGWPEPLIYLKELCWTWWWLLRSGVQWQNYIGMDGLCVFFGYWLKLMGRVRRTIFWAIDFVPEARFSSPVKNWIYHQVNLHGYRHSDEMWDLSPRMAEARQKYLGFPTDGYHQWRLVPYGCWLDRIPHLRWQDCRQHQLVFMGILLEKQGVQLVLQAIPQIVAQLPDFHFLIIGGGPYRAELEKLAAELKVTAYCTFTGKIPDHQELERRIAESGVAVAPYIAALDTWTYYADPGKVKTYLACGVPVVLTDLPWNARAIEAQGAGLIVTESPAAIATAVMKLMQSKRANQYRSRAVEFAQSYSYHQLFRAAEKYLDSGKR